MNFVNHEHEGEWIFPTTIGATEVRACTICGMYETRDSSLTVLVRTKSINCRHCGDPLAKRDPMIKDLGGDYSTHAHGLYRCQHTVSYGHNATHPDVPCESGVPNPCKCTYAPD